MLNFGGVGISSAPTHFPFALLYWSAFSLCSILAYSSRRIRSAIAWKKKDGCQFSMEMSHREKKHGSYSATLR